MSFDIFIAFLSNILLLMGLAVVYSLLPTDDRINPLGKKIIIGLIASLIGVTIMANPYELMDGIFVDARSVLVSLSGMFFGLIPTAIVVVVLSIFRFIIGGSGATTGIFWIISSAVIGLIWRHFRLKNIKFEHIRITWTEMYVVSLMLQIINVLLLFTLPTGIQDEVMGVISLPLLLIYPLGSLLVGVFMLRQRQQFFDNLQVKRSEKQYRKLFSNSFSANFIINPETGQIFEVNNQAVELYGYSLEDLKSMTIMDLIVSNKIELSEFLKESQKREYSYLTAKQITKNKRILDVEIYLTPIEIDNNIYLHSNIFDITQKRTLEQRFEDYDEKLQTTLLSIGEGVIITDHLGNIELINSQAKDLIEVNGSCRGKKVQNIVRTYSRHHETDFKVLFDNVIQNQETYRTTQSFSLITNITNREVFIDFTLSPIFKGNSTTQGIVMIFRDVSMNQKEYEQIQFISQHDHLTKLYNRFFFEDQVQRLDTKRQLPITLVMGDVNGLKECNDQFGHHEGDLLLKEIASILKKATRSEDIVCRWGGDEFAILLPQTEEIIAEKIKQRIHSLCEKSLFSTIKPSISIGYSTKTDDSQNIVHVLKQAETNMYADKNIYYKSTSKKQ